MQECEILSDNYNCVSRLSKFGAFSSPNFLVFELDLQISSVNLHFLSKYVKTTVQGIFHLSRTEKALPRKHTFLTHWYAHVIRGKEIIFFAWNIAYGLNEWVPSKTPNSYTFDPMVLLYWN